MSAVNNFDPDKTDLLRNVTLTGYGERTSYIAGPPLSLLFEGARGGYDVKLHVITATRSPRRRLLAGVSFTPSTRGDARCGPPPTMEKAPHLTQTTAGRDGIVLHAIDATPSLGLRLLVGVRGYAISTSGREMRPAAERREQARRRRR